MFHWHKKKNTIVNTEWNFFRGGFLHLGHMNWIIAQSFAKRGQSFLGTEQDFIARLEFALDHENKFSWFTLELVNLFEARWLYLWFRVWPGHNLRLVINLGWRLTRASRDHLERQVIEHERRTMQSMRRAQQNGVNSKKEIII